MNVLSLLHDANISYEIQPGHPLSQNRDIEGLSHMIPEKRMPVSLLFVLWVPIRTGIRTQIKHIKTDAVAFLHNIRWTYPQMQQ